jgi:hypothetical protein
MSDMTGMPTAAVASGPRRAGATKNPWVVWALGLVTLGIYSIVWYYKVQAEVRDFGAGQIKSQPGMSMLAVFLGFGIGGLVSWIKTAGRIRQAQQLAGIQPTCSAGLGFLIGLVGFGVVYYQAELNKVWARYGAPPAGAVLPG